MTCCSCCRAGRSPGSRRQIGKIGRGAGQLIDRIEQHFRLQTFGIETRVVLRSRRDCDSFGTELN